MAMIARCEMRKIEIEIDEKELWSNVFGSAFESFGNHWYEVEYLSGDWDEIGSVRLGIMDEMTEEVTSAIVGIDELLAALPIANKQTYMDLLNFDNYDAVCGDAILQVAVLGKVVYG
jgi:hypothetical protein